MFDMLGITMLGQDIALLLKLSLQEGPRVLSKKLASELFLSPSEVSKSLYRSKMQDYSTGPTWRKGVNRSGLLEFLAHGMRYVFPPERGSMVRGIL
jgi:hypothetical protein